MRLKDTPKADRPREKLIAKGAENLVSPTYMGPSRNDIDFLSIYASGKEAYMLSSKKEILIRKYFLRFNLWKGKPVENSYGNKAVINWKGTPVFAELAVLRLFQENRWKGVWVDSYHRKFRVGLPGIADPVQLSTDKKKLIDTIKAKAGVSGGCWDIFVWKGDRVLFLELKRQKKDKLQPSQYKWLDASMRIGFKPSNFVIIEWDLADELASV